MSFLQIPHLHVHTPHTHTRVLQEILKSMYLRVIAEYDNYLLALHSHASFIIVNQRYSEVRGRTHISYLQILCVYTCASVYICACFLEAIVCGKGTRMQ